MKKMVRILMVVFAGLLLLVTAGCDDGGKPPAGSGKPGEKISQPVPKKKEMTAVKIYYPDRQGEWLHEVTAQVSKEDRYQEALQLIVSGTKEKGLMGIFPKGTKIKSLSVKNGRATVDFSKEMATNFPGGSMVEEMMYGSVVNTLTAFPEIKTVKIYIDGKDTKILSNMDIVDPFERMPEMIKR